MSKPNPRKKNGSRRNKLRQRVKSLGLPCHICGKPIDYELPAGNPMAFELDEIIPVSKYWLGGYETPTQCALDPENVAPAHRICNQRKGNKLVQKPAKNLGDIPHSRKW